MARRKRQNLQTYLLLRDRKINENLRQLSLLIHLATQVNILLMTHPIYFYIYVSKVYPATASTFTSVVDVTILQYQKTSQLSINDTLG